jgi:hypothetical protein
VRGLRIRRLGTASFRSVAWKAAALPGWPDTFDAGYVALTQLHADALIILDRVPPDCGGCPRAGLEQPLVTQHRN